MLERALYEGPPVTYSLHYKQTRDYAGNVSGQEKIPRMTDEAILKTLQYLRDSAPIMQNSTVQQFFRERRSMDVEPELNSPEWSDLNPYFWYNILLDPYQYGQPISGKSYATHEDRSDPADQLVVDEGSPVDFPPRQPLDRNMGFDYNLFEIIIGQGTPEEAMLTMYVSPPSEQEVVDYIRAGRKHFDSVGDNFMFALFHNLLIPYVFV